MYRDGEQYDQRGDWWSRKFESMSKGKSHWTLQEDGEGFTGTSFLPEHYICTALTSIMDFSE